MIASVPDLCIFFTIVNIQRKGDGSDRHRYISNNLFSSVTLYKLAMTTRESIL